MQFKDHVNKAPPKAKRQPKHRWRGDVKVLEKEWRATDIEKAFFVIHDIGVWYNNRTPQRYEPEDQAVGWKPGKAGYYPMSVHGWLNWGGVYCPAYDFAKYKLGTKHAFKPRYAQWRRNTVEVECVPLLYYGKGPKDTKELDAELRVILQNVFDFLLK